MQGNCRVEEKRQFSSGWGFSAEVVGDLYCVILHHSHLHCLEMRWCIADTGFTTKHTAVSVDASSVNVSTSVSAMLKVVFCEELLKRVVAVNTENIKTAP